MSALDLDWREPPDPKTPVGVTREDYDDIAHALRQNPGRWARVGQVPPGRASSTLYHAFRRRGMKVTSRRTVSGGVDMYARYVEVSDG